MKNQKPDEFINNILINENNKKIFFNKWKYEYKQNIEIINEEENNNESNINQKPTKLPFTDILYEPEYMLIIKNNQIQVNYEMDYLYIFFQALIHEYL